MRKIDQLKAILESQIFDPLNWTPLDPKIVEKDDLILEVDAVQVGFSFDKSGENFQGVFNYRDKRMPRSYLP